MKRLTALLTNMSKKLSGRPSPRFIDVCLESVARQQNGGPTCTGDPPTEQNCRGAVVQPRKVAGCHTTVKANMAASLCPPGCQLETQSSALILKPRQHKRERFAFVRFNLQEPLAPGHRQLVCAALNGAPRLQSHHKLLKLFPFAREVAERREGARRTVRAHGRNGFRCWAAYTSDPARAWQTERHRKPAAYDMFGAAHLMLSLAQRVKPQGIEAHDGA